MQETYLYCKLQDWRKWQKLDKKKTGKRSKKKMDKITNEWQNIGKHAKIGETGQN